MRDENIEAMLLMSDRALAVKKRFDDMTEYINAVLLPRVAKLETAMKEIREINQRRAKPVDSIEYIIDKAMEEEG